jgi:hypothetical protein
MLCLRPSVARAPSRPLNGLRYAAMRFQPRGTSPVSRASHLRPGGVLWWREWRLMLRRHRTSEDFMTNRRNWIALSVASFALTAICSLALAEYHELKEPHLVIKDYSEANYKALKAVLDRNDCKFLGGGELNAASSLRYGGDTTALNKFIAALSLCPKVIVHVKFYHPRTPGVECDWAVTQMAPSSELVVRVNLASEKVDMEKLYLPPVKAEKAPD